MRRTQMPSSLAPAMPTGRSETATRPAPVRMPAARSGEVDWAEIDASFKKFRESAVRLVERVNDLMGADGAAVAIHERDLRLVRTVFGKWSAEILVVLHTAPAFGFEDLRRHLPGISPRVLSLKLKELEQHGMIVREILASRPPRTRYALTDRGWTVAWLADPVLLYLRQTASRPNGDGARPGNRSPATPG
jgi:DNA-binding HxlR family transcriptional regulator